MSRVKRSGFRRLPKNSCTMKAGYLYPIFVKPTMPGDSWRIKLSDAIRALPMLAPCYADVSVSFQAFYVENRLLMDDWWDFRTGGKNNDDATVLPYMLHSQAKKDVGFGTLSDFLSTAPALTFYDKDSKGVYVANNKVLRSRCLAERAYAKIINDWYINQNLQEDLPLSTANGDDGEDTVTNRDLFRRNWNHDYFTNQFNTQQKGPQAIIPIGSQAPVIGNGIGLGLYDGVQNRSLAARNYSGNTLQQFDSYGAAVGSAAGNFNGRTDVVLGITTDPEKSGLVADLSGVTGIPISVINLAVAGQKMATKLLLHGSRSVEWLNSMFGVKSSDARLDRSSFLGSYTTDMIISPVLQTSSTDSTSPQGNQAGTGFHSMTTPEFKCYCEEDGWIMIFASIRPRTQYCQGLPAYHNYSVRSDYPVPAFAHLDFTLSKNSEIYAQGVANGNENTDWDAADNPDNQGFGYHPIFQEWRTFPSEVHGEFLNTMQYYTQARIFDNLPQLTSEFIECKPTQRQFSDTSDSDKYLCDFLFDIKLKRKLPKFGTPRYF